MKKIIVILSYLTLTSCASVDYISPDTSNLSDEPYSIQLNKSYDEAWNMLVNYSGRTFFAIDNFEKSSGLMTLSFSSTDISEYVKGGFFKVDGITQFSGDYAHFLESNDGELTGRINLVVQEVDENSTKITVNTRYVVSAPTSTNSEINTWTFNTNGYDSVRMSGNTGSDPVRVLMPTHNLEKEILSEFE